MTASERRRMIDELDLVFAKQLRGIKRDLRAFVSRKPKLTRPEHDAQAMIRDKHDLQHAGILERRGLTKHAPGGR